MKSNTPCSLTIIVTRVVDVDTIKMYAQLFAITMPVIIILSVNLVNCGIDHKFIDNAQHPVLAKLVRMRCTRRFSPGVCVDDVAPVWTFVFLQQNCTERLGCPNNYRTNRFRSYRMCMKRCRGLVDMYLKMVEIEQQNSEENVTLDDEIGDDNFTDDHILRERFGTKQRYHVPVSKVLPVDLEDLSQDSEDEEYGEEVQDSRFIEYKDYNMNEDIIPADLDYVPGVIRSEVDWMRF